MRRPSHPLTVRQLCHEAGVRLRWTSKGVPRPIGNPISWRGLAAGMSYIDGSKPTLYVTPRASSILIHELCHFLVGPSSLDDEESLMVLHWALIPYLRPTPRDSNRQLFLWSYRFGRVAYDELPLEAQKKGRPGKPRWVHPEEFPGHSFTRTTRWKEMSYNAYHEGLVTKKGTPYWRNLEVSSKWPDYFLDFCPPSGLVQTEGD